MFLSMFMAMPTSSILGAAKRKDGLLPTRRERRKAICKAWSEY